MTSTVRAYDIGCEPSPSVSAETLLQDGWKTYLLFFAVTQAVQETGYLKDLGVAVLECINASSAKMGYPNDEGLPEHPLWDHGLSAIESSIVDVSGSQWLADVRDQQDRSAKRIWGGRGTKWTPSTGLLKHFVITFKEATFECIAEDLIVVEYAPDFDAAFTYVISELKKH
ncbi:MAG: hypothetical protein M3552_01870 [Planctomycetota bacterium]|nr:hypothetical protein [Planctomycetota bacterium]